MTGAARSLALLEEQIAHLPDDLAEDAARPQPALPQGLRTDGYVWVTGAGASEGPARVLVEELAAAGRGARFVPLSPFALEASPPPETTLVLFSQGLSPNARLALARRGAFASTVVVSAVSPEGVGEAADLLREACAAGALLWPHGPPWEPPLLLRTRGPARATLAALRLAHAISGTTRAPPPLAAPVRAALDQPVPAAWSRAADAVALVSASMPPAMTHGLRWKLLEGAGLPVPPAWDVLQVAHGPLQQLWDRPATLLGLVVEPAEEALLDRLETVLAPERHQLVRIRSTLPMPWAWFELDAAFDGLVLDRLRRCPRDLLNWPGQGHDEALYELGVDGPP